jgi:predicted RNase H-like nuclease (RuvC/YqgF family)
MKDLKKEVQAVTKELKALTRKTEAMAKKVAKLEKAQTTAKRKPKARAKVKAAKKAPAKKKGVAKLTATDQVVNIIKRSKKGADVPTLMKKTGLVDKTLRNILFRAGKLGKIKRAGRGVYVGA